MVLSMNNEKTLSFNSPLGRQKSDSSGSPIGIVRMDVSKSYEGISELLQKFINNSDHECWDQIKAKIDYTYSNLDYALSCLEQATSFIAQIKEKLKLGQKLLFKPNIVLPLCIDSETHGAAIGCKACTEWAFIAALMRWFHEKAGISYYKMSLGEAPTALTATANAFSKTNPEGKEITPEAVLEGKSGDFYGGWGFYFVRKYLFESLTEGESEDPFKGYEESINGIYIAPGYVSDKLMIYDLNRIYDDLNKGRKCDIPDGVNFKSIVLHKAIIGGDPEDLEDRKAYPGCVLINVPKFKVHAIALFTNIIKNLGIGLYPMQYSSEGAYKWDYAGPHGTPVVGAKSGIPHQVWIPEIDQTTSLPKRDTEGNYITYKSGGIIATMIDIIKAVSNQGILMFHIVDGIKAINIDHQGNGAKTAEGMVFAGLDPVATDLLCARYMFSNVPFKESLEVKLEGGIAGGFPQKVPIPIVDGQNIISTEGYDCPLARDFTFERAEKRGLGKKDYYVNGYDVLTESPIVSLKGHLGSVLDDNFSDIITSTLFYDLFKVPWDMQQSTLNYLAAQDHLDGTNLKEELLQHFDENNDGVISYEEFGKNGSLSIALQLLADYVSTMGREELGHLKGFYKTYSSTLKYADKRFNSHGQDIMGERLLLTNCAVALAVSLMPMELPDPFVSGRTCGNGKWPSIQYAQFLYFGNILYGPEFPLLIGYPSLYSNAFFYADLTQNGGKYAGKLRSSPDLKGINKYFREVRRGKIKPLDFVLYVPAEFINLSGKKVPNVETTEDLTKIFTVNFQQNNEIW